MIVSSKSGFSKKSKSKFYIVEDKTSGGKCVKYLEYL